MRCLLIFVAGLAWSASASAAGNVFAVLPTQGVGATAEAVLVTQVMRLALQEQSLAMVPAQQTESAVVAHAVACGQSAIACGRLVGEATSATHVIVSELWDQAGALELKIALVAVRVDGAPVWQTHRAKSADEVGPVAKRAVLALVAPDALSGLLSVTGDTGVEVVVDGVVAERTPLVSPVKLAAGQREIELRLAGHRPLRTTVAIESQRTTSIVVCAKDGAVVRDACGDGAAVAPMSPLVIAGSAGVGLGVVAGVGAVVAAIAAESAYAAFDADRAEEDANAYFGWRTVGIASGIAGGVLTAVGAGVLVVGLVE